jgi:serine/threonine protein kinase
MQFYKLGKLLGKGAFGKVNMGLQILTNSLVAIKSISKHLMTNEASKTKVMREVAIWEQLKHQSINRYSNNASSALGFTRPSRRRNIFSSSKSFVEEEMC